MNTRLIIWLVLVAGVMCICACEKDIIIELDDHEPKLVVNAMQELGEPLWVNVSRSYAFTENPTTREITIKNAEVEMFENGASLGIFKYKDTLTYIPRFSFGTDSILEYFGIYYAPSGAVAISGATYEVRVSHPDFEPASARFIMPSKVVLDTAEVELNAIRSINPSGFEEIFNIATIQFQDPQDELNCYKLGLLAFLDGTPFGASVDTFSYVYLEIIDDWVPTQQVERSYNYFFSDANYTGQAINQDFAIPISSTITNNLVTTQARPIKYVFFLTTMSCELAEFMDGALRQSRSISFNPLFTGEAVFIPSNIEGGYGVFGGTVKSSFEVVF